MQDKMIPIRGYFKVDKVVDGEVVDTYEDKNTVMARIPQLFAGMASGNYTLNLQEYRIGCIALGTGGIRQDTLGNDVLKEVRDDRTMLFAEHDFWNTPIQEQEEQPVVFDKYKHVYQSSFDVIARGDLGLNTTYSTPIEVQNRGPIYPAGGGPALNWIPDPLVYRDDSILADEDQLSGAISLQQNMIEYTFTLGQFAGNAEDDTARGYSEAGLYLVYGADTKLDEAGDPIIGNPLGTLFSMKTFPSQWKNSTCALKITWKLFF